MTDVDASIPVENVFGNKAQDDVPHEGGVGKLLGTDAMDLMSSAPSRRQRRRSLRRAGDRLDHAGFVVPTRDDLVAWQDHLEANGVVRAAYADKPLTQSPIADEPYASVLVFRDPDNIQLELFAPVAR